RMAKARPALQQLQLERWTEQSLKNGQVTEGLTIEEAFRLAMGMGRIEEIEQLSTPPEDFAESDLLRLRTMIKTAATIVVISADSASDEIRDWCLKVLLAASQIQTVEHYFASHSFDARWEIKS